VAEGLAERGARRDTAAVARNLEALARVGVLVVRVVGKQVALELALLDLAGGVTATALTRSSGQPRVVPRIAAHVLPLAVGLLAFLEQPTGETDRQTESIRRRPAVVVALAIATVGLRADRALGLPVDTDER
jgi:hypothetical protein